MLTGGKLPTATGRAVRLLVLAVAVLFAGVGGYTYLARPVGTVEPPASPAPVAEATAEQVRQFCGACHAYPPPDSFPRPLWQRGVQQGFDFFRASNLPREQAPSLASVVNYYEN